MTIATAPTTSVDTQPLLLDVSNTILTVTPEQFDILCIDNPDLRLELTPNRELIVMTPAGWESSEKNGDLFGEVWYWNRQSNLGRAFDSSGGFTLSNGAVRSPDVTWIEKSKLADIPTGVKFPQITPDFVIELRSDTDNLKPLQEKMQEYRENGVRLGLLVNPKNKRVEIYRPGQEPEVLESPESIDCNEVMPGFVLSLKKIW
jgi:Uma2 family endonuclease